MLRGALEPFEQRQVFRLLPMDRLEVMVDRDLGKTCLLQQVRHLLGPLSLLEILAILVALVCFAIAFGGLRCSVKSRNQLLDVADHAIDHRIRH